MTPGDFSTIRSRIESSSFLSAPEKNEWLSALPHMTAEHIKELDRILAIKAPGVATSDKRLEQRKPNQIRSRPSRAVHLPRRRAFRLCRPRSGQLSSQKFRRLGRPSPTQQMPRNFGVSLWKK